MENKMIDSYRFGEIAINGKTYHSDLIIYPDKVDASWWRKQGHNLCLDDIKDIIDYNPEVLIIGQGKSGLMMVPERIKSVIRNMGIDVYISGTDKAVQTYNEMYKNRKVVAALHLTC